MTLIVFAPDVSVGVFPHPAEFARLTRPCAVSKPGAGDSEKSASLYEHFILSHGLSGSMTYSLGNILVRPTLRLHPRARLQQVM